MGHSSPCERNDEQDAQLFRVTVGAMRSVKLRPLCRHKALN